MKDQSPARRAAAYWYADGLPDLIFGATLLLFATGGLLWQVFAPHQHALDLYLMSIGFALHFWKERDVLDFLKSRMTYPRTGYAQPPEEGPVNQRGSLISLNIRPARPSERNVTSFRARTVAVVFWVIYQMFFNRNPPRWFTPVIMLVVALALYLTNRNSEHQYRGWWAFVLALSGLIFLRIDVRPQLQPLLCYLIVGGWIAAYGVFTLIQYRNANPDRLSEGTLQA